jgi:large subunit ribosomal protein L6
MSRIGRLPVVIPQGVDFNVDAENLVTVKGPKGQLTSKMHKDMLITIEDGKVIINRPSEEKLHRSLHGLTRSLVNNMVEGVSKGFEKTLDINGVGYRATKQGSKLAGSRRAKAPKD